MKLEGGERLVLKTLKDLQDDSNDYVDDARLAAATKMVVDDVRDWLESLEGKGFVERARGTEGFSAYVTAKGKQALRLTEPMPRTNPVVEASPKAPAGLLVSPTPHPGSAATEKTTEPIRLFYSYTRKDEPLRDELAKHLSVLERENLIAPWHDGMIGAGEEWKGAIDRYLEEAQIILLLVSPDFLASAYCYDVETKRAVERHDRGEARVIPIILRPCDWHRAPFGKLQAVPQGGKAVTSWRDPDEAWADVARGIRRAVEVMTANPR